jgi:hypothetical protein
LAVRYLPFTAWYGTRISGPGICQRRRQSLRSVVPGTGRHRLRLAGPVPFYGRLGWQVFPGELIVKQRGETAKFTLCGSMTFPLRLQADLDGTIDLLGPPW